MGMASLTISDGKRAQAKACILGLDHTFPLASHARVCHG